MDKIGVGIVGCGTISTAYLRLAPLFSALDVRAVADLDPAAAERQSAAFGPRALGVDDLIAAPDIDMVLNLTVPNAHFEISRRALEAGKHSYTEKPFVLTLEEGETLREIAARKSLRIGASPDTFLGGAHQLARSALDEGRIGHVSGATAHVMSHGMEAWHPNPDFFFQPGGGPILDQAPYYITNLVQLLGPVAAVTALAGAGSRRRTIGSGPRAGESVPVDISTTVQALLQFHSGPIVTLGASWDVWSHGHNYMEIYGEDGSLFLPDPNFFGGDVSLVSAAGEEEVLSWDHPFGVENIEDSRGNPRANYRTAGLAEMASAIAEDRAHRTGLDFSLHVVDVMTSILSAGERRDWVELTTTCERPAALSPDQARSLLA